MRNSKGQFKKGYKPEWTEKSRKKLSDSIKGRKMPPRTEEWKRKMSIAQKGKPKPLVSERLKGNIPWNKGKKCPQLSGQKCHLWKGGISLKNRTERRNIMSSLEYKLWRKSVFERDNFTCVFCGQVSGDIEADHIKSFSSHPELRFAIDNGRTLCHSCHKKTDNYGNKKIFLCKAETAEWKDFLRQAQKMLKDKGKKESKMTKF